MYLIVYEKKLTKRVTRTTQSVVQQAIPHGPRDPAGHWWHGGSSSCHPCTSSCLQNNDALWDIISNAEITQVVFWIQIACIWHVSFHVSYPATSYPDISITRPWSWSIPRVPKKAERWIFSTLRAKSIIFVYVIRSNNFRRRYWYQDH